jgi:hypothetical protein
MEPVDKPVIDLISEKQADPFFFTIALSILILVRLALSCVVSSINSISYCHIFFIPCGVV